MVINSYDLIELIVYREQMHFIGPNITVLRSIFTVLQDVTSSLNFGCVMNIPRYLKIKC